jgi:hypothetical protein
MRNGDVITAKVEQVGIAEIKYHKTDNLSGPMYAVAKSDVFMIKYQNGYKDVFSNSESHKSDISASLPAKKQKAAPDYLRLLQKGQRRVTAGATLTGLGGGLLIAGITVVATTHNPFSIQSNEKSTLGALLIVGGVASVIVGPIILSNGMKNRRKGQKVAIISFSPIINSNLDCYCNTITQNPVGTLSITF